MADVDSATLMASIQAVEMAIKLQEKMLEADVIGVRADTEEFIFILENAKAKLKSAYLKEKMDADNLPDYEQLLEVRI